MTEFDYLGLILVYGVLVVLCLIWDVIWRWFAVLICCVLVLDICVFCFRVWCFELLVRLLTLILACNVCCFCWCCCGFVGFLRMFCVVLGYMLPLNLGFWVCGLRLLLLELLVFECLTLIVRFDVFVALFGIRLWVCRLLFGFECLFGGVVGLL